MRASRLAHLFALAAAGLSSQQALADTINVYQSVTPPSGSGTVATFDDLTAQPFGAIAPYSPGPFTDGGAIFSGSAVIMNNPTQGSGGLYAQPYNDNTNYMAVLGGGSETIAYAGPRTSFGLYWGSVDTYNSLQFLDGSTVVATIAGANVSPLLDNGGQTSYASNSYVLISGLPQFTSVKVASSSNSFEFDNVVATPEPSTWAMLGTGFLALASFATRRSRKDRLGPSLA